MQVTAKFDPSKQENLVDLVAEAITCSIPPLSQESILKTNQIIEARLADLEGTTRYLAEQIFSNIAELPPVIGFEFAQILKTIMKSTFLVELRETDFTDSNIFARLTASTEAVMKAPQPQHIVNEWGYASVSGTFEGESSPHDFNLDMLKARRLGSSKIDNIFTLLSQIESPEVRQVLANDCLTIMKLRLDFDFRERPKDS